MRRPTSLPVTNWKPGAATDLLIQFVFAPPPSTHSQYTELFRLEREEVEDSRWVEAQVNGCRTYYLDCGNAGLCSGD